MNRAEKKRKTQRDILNNKPLGYRMLIPSTLMILAISVYPLLNGIWLSFQNYNLLKPKKQGFAGLSNYVKLLTDDPEFLSVLGFTFVYTIAVVAIAYVMGLIFAMLLNRDIKFRGLFRALILIPWIIPPIVAATNWAWLFNDQIGLINTTLMKIGLIDKPILFISEPQMARFSVIWTSAWKSFPFMMITLLAGLQSIPEDLYEAAEIDGAGFFGRFRHITMPMLSSVTIVCTTLMFIWTFNSMENIYLLTRGGPNQATFVLSILTYFTAFMRSDIGYASTIATVLLIVLLILTSIYIKVINRASRSEF